MKKEHDSGRIFLVAVAAVILISAIILFYFGKQDEPAQDAEFPEEKVVCNSPYIRHGADCCLDQNSNAICDADEPQEKSKGTTYSQDASVPGESAPGTAVVSGGGSSSDGAAPVASSGGSSNMPVPGESAPETIVVYVDSSAGDTAAAETVSTETSCTDGIDNDGDGLMDVVDIDCKGRSCGEGSVWVWTHADLGANQNIAPSIESIHCCRPDECVSSTGGVKSCNPYDAPYDIPIPYRSSICASNNDWDLCSGSRIGALSEGGGYQCVEGYISLIGWAAVEDSETACFDGIDNDRDGSKDSKDWDCVGRSCGSGAVLIWSYLPGEDTAQIPPQDGSGRRRIACCVNANSCANINGECIAYDTFYSSSPYYICGNNHIWDRCTSKLASFNTVSDGGDHYCSESSGGELTWKAVVR